MASASTRRFPSTRTARTTASAAEAAPGAAARSSAARTPRTIFVARVPIAGGVPRGRAVVGRRSTRAAESKPSSRKAQTSSWRAYGPDALDGAALSSPAPVAVPHPLAAHPAALLAPLARALARGVLALRAGEGTPLRDAPLGVRQERPRVAPPRAAP